MLLESSQKISQKINLPMCTLTQLQTQLYSASKKPQDNIQKHQERLRLSFENFTCISSLKVDF